jgi:hypothetical protein
MALGGSPPLNCLRHQCGPCSRRRATSHSGWVRAPYNNLGHLLESARCITPSITSPLWADCAVRAAPHRRGSAQMGSAVAFVACWCRPPGRAMPGSSPGTNWLAFCSCCSGRAVWAPEQFSAKAAVACGWACRSCSLSLVSDPHARVCVLPRALLLWAHNAPGMARSATGAGRRRGRRPLAGLAAAYLVIALVSHQPAIGAPTRSIASSLWCLLAMSCRTGAVRFPNAWLEGVGQLKRRVCSLATMTPTKRAHHTWYTRPCHLR